MKSVYIVGMILMFILSSCSKYERVQDEYGLNGLVSEISDTIFLQKYDSIQGKYVKDRVSKIILTYYKTNGMPSKRQYFTKQKQLFTAIDYQSIGDRFVSGRSLYPFENAYYQMQYVYKNKTQYTVNYFSDTALMYYETIFLDQGGLKKRCLRFEGTDTVADHTFTFSHGFISKLYLKEKKQIMSYTYHRIDGQNNWVSRSCVLRREAEITHYLETRHIQYYSKEELEFYKNLRQSQKN